MSLTSFLRSVTVLLTCNVRSVLCVLCGPLRLCVEYRVLKERDAILNAKTQRTAKHAEAIKQRIIPSATQSSIINLRSSIPYPAPLLDSKQSSPVILHQSQSRLLRDTVFRFLSTPSLQYRDEPTAPCPQNV